MTTDDHDGHSDKGTMDITAQEKTFAGFLRMVSWGAGISIGLLVFLALVNV